MENDNEYCKFDFVIDSEPDIIETAQGYAPNYEKFERMGFTTEEALVWCNID